MVFSAQILGQGLQFKFNQDINVSNSKGIFKNAWAGGLNAVQFAQIDLNGDGFEDVLAFDRTNQKVFTYINKSVLGGAIALAYDPIFEKYFPSVENWIILCDYDGDKRKDLFTSTSAGVKVYRNISVGSNIKFEVVSEALFSEGFSSKINLYVAASDIPAIGDLDGDGDKKESMKKAATDAKSGASKKKSVAIKESAMSEIDLLAQESKTFKSFVRAFKKEYSNLDAGDNKELESWLKSVYDSANAKANESWDPRDAYEYGATSNCCGASVMMGDICSDCGEHCEAEYWDEEGDGENPEEFGSPASYNEGHTCHNGKKSMLSEAAHHLIESICESTCSDASMYEDDEDPEHKFDGYVNEACAYMEKCMYEMVDDGSTINEAWNNESNCYESTCEMVKEVCEKLCEEALEIHNDETPTEYNEYVAEAIGCYKNGLMECGMGWSGSQGVNESEESEDVIFAKAAQWLADPKNQELTLSMSKNDQAAQIGITPDQYENAIAKLKTEI